MMTKREQRAQQARAHILARLALGYADIEALAAAAFMAVRNVRHHLAALRADKLVRIERWRDPSCNYPRPYYALGNKPDAPRPPARSGKEKAVIKRAKLKADDHAYDLSLARRRAARRPVRADPLVQALFQ